MTDNVNGCRIRDPKDKQNTVSMHKKHTYKARDRCMYYMVYPIWGWLWLRLAKRIALQLPLRLPKVSSYWRGERKLFLSCFLSIGIFMRQDIKIRVNFSANKNAVSLTLCLSRSLSLCRSMQMLLELQLQLWTQLQLRSPQQVQHELSSLIGRHFCLLLRLLLLSSEVTLCC